MKIDTWHIILIIAIIVLLIWYFSRNNSHENFNQYLTNNFKNKSDLLQSIISLVINHMFLEKQLMITYFTDKANLRYVENNLIKNVSEMNSYIRTYNPIMADFIDQQFMSDIKPYFDLHGVIIISVSF